MSISYIILMSDPIQHDLYNVIMNYTRPSTLALKQFCQYSNIYHHINLFVNINSISALATKRAKIVQYTFVYMDRQHGQK